MINEQAMDQGPWAAFAGLPGNPLMWVLILSELAVFGAFFLAFAIARVISPAGFAAGQASLDVTLGTINTLVLIIGSWCAARAAHAIRLSRTGPSRLWLGAAMACGGAFCLVKLVEYADKVKAGHGLEGDTFFTLYFLISGFHLTHVVAGTVLLGVVAWKASIDNIMTGTAFWHMVDMVWLVLFPLLYLLR